MLVSLAKLVSFVIPLKTFESEFFENAKYNGGA
jgi:hypothetical protein